jgi:HEAT repeat protein
MFQVDSYQSPSFVEVKISTATPIPVVIEISPESELDILAAELTPDTPWAQRQIAAKKLGQSQNPDALPILLAALPNDPFWMVRCTIIQALELISDARAIPALREVANDDEFSAVRSAAEKAVERLSQSS